MKLTRGAFRSYLDTTFGGTGTPSWYLVGKDIEDMSVDGAPDVETVTNILDETSVQDKGWAPTMEADPFYADPADPLYPKLKDIFMNRKKGDECKTTILEVLIDDTEAETHDAWTEEVYVKPTSLGGGTSGVSIPFTVHYAGNRKQGTVKIENKVPNFTETTKTT